MDVDLQVGERVRRKVGKLLGRTVGRNNGVLVGGERFVGKRVSMVGEVVTGRLDGDAVGLVVVGRIEGYRVGLMEGEAVGGRDGL